MARFDRLVAGLQAELARKHGEVKRVETHISAVLLAGDRAIKLKKPLALGFLDFSTLARRRRCCEAELELNRRFAPELYLEVADVTGSLEHPRLGGEGLVLDHAVVMRRFDEEAQLDRVLARGALTPEHIDRLGATLARLHAAAPVCSPRSRHAGPAVVGASARANLEWLQREPGPWQAVAAGLAEWTERSLARLGPLFRARRRAGRVRSCHGDLHLGNLVLLGEDILPFDCIEFSADLRVIDVMSDLAFLVMDLDVRDSQTLASRLLNVYLETGGDYDGLRVLRHYLVYRSLVRAKVALIRATQTGEATERAEARARAMRHVRLAERYAAGARPPLLLTRGLSGSGKSTLARALVEALGLVQLRSDVERKRLAGLAAGERSGSGLAQGLYSAEATRATYARLLAGARAGLAGGFGVIVDATFLGAAERAPFCRLAARMDVPLLVLDLEAPAEVLRERVASRLAGGRDASEATLAVLERQLARGEALRPADGSARLAVDASRPFDAPAVARQIAERLGGPPPSPR